jgi:hypothetical protein
MQRIQNLTVTENDVYSSSDNVLEFAFSQSGPAFTYNDYYTKDNNPCKAYFYRDTVGNGTSFKKDTTFNQYAHETGLDTTSYLGGIAYNRSGCGVSGASVVGQAEAGVASPFADSTSLDEYPNPVRHPLWVRFQASTAGAANLQLLDMSGRVLLRQDVELVTGINQIGWSDVKQQALASGIYIVQLITTTGRTSIKVFVQ